jgi:hypothetical protein
VGSRRKYGNNLGIHMEEDGAVPSIIFLSPGTDASIEYTSPAIASKGFLQHYAGLHSVHFLSSLYTRYILCWSSYRGLVVLYTDKKENIFLIHKEIQNRAVAKLYD